MLVNVFMMNFFKSLSQIRCETMSFYANYPAFVRCSGNRFGLRDKRLGVRNSFNEPLVLVREWIQKLKLVGCSSKKSGARANVIDMP